MVGVKKKMKKLCHCIHRDKCLALLQHVAVESVKTERTTSASCSWELPIVPVCYLCGQVTRSTD